MGTAVLAVINEEIGVLALRSCILARVCMRRPLRHSPITLIQLFSLSLTTIIIYLLSFIITDRCPLTYIHPHFFTHTPPRNFFLLLIACFFYFLQKNNFFLNTRRISQSSSSTLQCRYN